MTTGQKTLLFILLIPALAALGHDIYINFFENSEKLAKIEALDIEPEKFQFSDMGYLWLTYAPESYELARENTTPSLWSPGLNMILSLPSIVIGAIPAAIFSVIMIFINLLRANPFKRGISAAGHPNRENSRNKGSIKYTRK